MSRARISTYVDGKRLKGLRQSLGWTQVVAAEIAGYTERLIRKLEGGGPVDWQTLHDVVATYHEHLPTAFTYDIQDFVSSTKIDLLQDKAIRWLHAIYQDRNLSGIEHLLAPNVILQANGQTVTGTDAVKLHLTQILSDLNPTDFSVDHAVSSGINVCIFWSMRAEPAQRNHQSQATPGWINSQGCSLFVFRNQVIEHFRDHCDHSLMTQKMTQKLGE